jgi:tol-pal system protein YbgF
MRANPSTPSGFLRGLTWIAAVACINSATLVSAQLFGGDETARKQIAEQGKRIEELRQQNAQLSERLGRIDETLKGLASFNPALELSQQLERLRQEITQLRGQIEVNANEVQMASKRQRDMYVDLDTRMKRLEVPAAAGAVAPAAAGAAATVPQATDAEAQAYEAAQGQRKIGNYQGAIAGFRNFIAQYPKSTLSHRAQYWIGDSYYNLRDFKNAIASQQRLISAFPDSASVPDALLNIASSQLELGDAAAARRTLDGLVARYPASEAAEKARRRLATLK